MKNGGADFDYGLFPELETSRLRLRQLREDDAPAIFVIRGDYAVTRYNIGRPYRHLSQARELVQSIHRSYRDQRSIRWGIVLKPTDEVIGMCGYNYWSREDHRASIGYDLARLYWGNGIMPEALNAIIRFGFERMALNRVEADASVYNDASTRVLYKLGFQQEGRQREQYYEDGRYHDLLLFALLRREYFMHQSS
jgi:ribosomal-protein-alanine N-acetyltransferase